MEARLGMFHDTCLRLAGAGYMLVVQPRGLHDYVPQAYTACTSAYARCAYGLIRLLCARLARDVRTARLYQSARIRARVYIA